MSGELSDLSAAVFGLGDTKFKDYWLGGAKTFVQALEKAGAEMIVPMGQGNDKDPEGAYTALGPWLTRLTTALGLGEEMEKEYVQPQEIPVVYCTGKQR
eukprot:JZ552940.1.p2 GENE.JZ552940.1~~JZ552940.1.p2  ORF type:complete len:99 (-),score=46.07 JZ552940.1:200-496(-)